MLKIQHVDIECFRNFQNIGFEIGNKITVISGQNGVGKSNLISLIASGSGVSRKAYFGSNFQPEFYDFFNIDPTEDYGEYKIFLRYGEKDNNSNNIIKRLSFKDDSKTNRGIRVIPRTSNKGLVNIGLREAEALGRDKFGIGGAARVPIPTIYLSISRLYPLGERKETVNVKLLNKSDKLYQTEAHIKFREWYNAVIPGCIKENGALSVVEKKTSARASLHMEMINTPTLSQSIGQDNIGNIISALVDIYIFSKQEKYEGAIICIDEIEVSLHPDTQIRLLCLMDKLASELNIQFIVSTHSLTILKEMLRKQKRCYQDYSVVYLKNPSLPIVTAQKSYELLKADLLGHTTCDRPKPKMYFEDEIGKHLFEMLVDSLYYQYEIIHSGDVLRGNISPETLEKIRERLENIKRYTRVLTLVNPVVAHLGCEELIKLTETKDLYFDRIIFMLDGDARYKEPEHKPQARDYLGNRFYNPRTLGRSDRQHSINVCFLPNYFAPESFLYRIIYRIVNDEAEHAIFWRTLDQNEETALYTANKVREWFANLPVNFNNDDLKNIFKDYSTHDINANGDIWRFLDTTHILNYFYCDSSTINELITFFEQFHKAFEIAYTKTMENRYA